MPVGSPGERGARRPQREQPTKQTHLPGARKKSKPQPPPAPAAASKGPITEQLPAAVTGYEQRRERSAKKDAEKSKSARDIAPVPAVVNPERRERCRQNFEAFCREYFPEAFNLAWSADHRRVIAKIEAGVVDGGQCAYAMPRGSGKTTLVLAAILWALLYGHRRFVAVIASDGPRATKLLVDVKTELECNEQLMEDFPEACYPVRRLDGIAQRANGQLCGGERTHIKWADNEIVLAAIKGAMGASGCVRTAGLGAGIRGMKFTRPDGKGVRPDMVILDDPQTDDSAKSPTQVADREKTIKGAVLGLAGPGKEIAAFMACTVVCPDDLADRLLDRNKHPEWNGERTKLLYGWPKREELWEQYAKIRNDARRAGDKNAAEATAFYRANREAMDEGATAAWPVRHYKHEESAVQHAMNLCQDLGKPVFFAEYQNEPVAAERDADELTADQVLAKANGTPRGEVPMEATKLVAFIDVQKEMLFYAVASLEDDFTGHVVDYGTYPDQKREHFTKATIKYPLSKVEGTARWEEALRKGLDTLASKLLGRDWKRSDGSTQKIERCHVDARWGDSTDLVKGFCRSNANAAILTPSFGVGVGPDKLPLTEQRKPGKGDRLGLHWLMPAPKPGKPRHIAFDANWWKSFLASRLAQGVGGRGCFTIFGTPDDHRLLADHLTAEFPTATQGRGRTVNVWRMRPGGSDNDFLDCVVGCCVAGSVAGSSLADYEKLAAAKPKRRVKLSERMYSR